MAGIKPYKVGKVTYWKIDVPITLPDGRPDRYRKRKIPTKEQAEILAAKVRAESFEGTFFDKRKASTLTVKEAWELYEPVTKRTNDTANSDAGRAKTLIRHLGGKLVEQLTREDVEDYREARGKETTRRQVDGVRQPPASATLDREIELLKRFINYAVECKKVAANPIDGIAMLNKPNVRKRVLKPEEFERLVEAADDYLRGILLVAHDTGMRKTEVLELRREWLDLANATLNLPPEFTKSEDPRLVILSARAVAAIRAQPTHIRSKRRGDEEQPPCPFIFFNPKTGQRWKDIRKAWRRACEASGVNGAWVHDLRRTFVTEARRSGVDQAVVMKMSGHKSDNVFKRYNIVGEEDIREGVAKMERARLLRQESGKAPKRETGSKKPRR